MASKMLRKKIIGSFLIIGTLLALYLTINVGYDLFWKHPAWMHRDGLMQKIGSVALYANILLLFIAGLTSTISFFRKGHLWKPITKGIIVNLFLWMFLAGMMVCLLVWGFTYKICGLLILGLCAWLLLRIWKMTKQ